MKLKTHLKFAFRHSYGVHIIYKWVINIVAQMQDLGKVTSY